MRISDWSSDVCSSDLPIGDGRLIFVGFPAGGDALHRRAGSWWGAAALDPQAVDAQWAQGTSARRPQHHGVLMWGLRRALAPRTDLAGALIEFCRSEEHTSELQSLMRISYAVFCLKKKNKYINITLKTP